MEHSMKTEVNNGMISEYSRIILFAIAVIHNSSFDPGDHTEQQVDFNVK